MRRTNLLMVLALAGVSGVFAQSFSSGSTGADRPLILASGVTSVQLPPSGILNYTTVNIPPGARLLFSPNATNTPVTLLASGNVTIAGVVAVDAYGNVAYSPIPGPGGFYGGAPFQSGVGPGAGQYGTSPNPTWVGPLSLVPIIGGSGGAGSGGSYAGGGGAILIASSVSISVTGTVTARGNQNPNVGAGAGADGAIRLVANSVNVSGSLLAAVVRLEAPVGSASYYC